MKAVEAVGRQDSSALCCEDALQAFSPVSARQPQPLAPDQEEKHPRALKGE